MVSSMTWTRLSLLLALAARALGFADCHSVQLQNLRPTGKKPTLEREYGDR
jgi:hypothetical protein